MTKRLSSKILAVVMAFIMALTIMAVPVFASDIRVSVNGEIIQFSEPLRTAQDRLLTPIRPISDALGAELRWNGYTRTATIIFGNTGVAIAMDNPVMVVRNMATGAEERVNLPVNGRIYGTTSFVPIEYVARALGLNTNWDATNRITQITTPDFVPSEVVGGGEVAQTPTLDPNTLIQTPTPIQLQNVLGRDIEPFRLTDMQAFSRTSLGNMMGAEYEYGFRSSRRNGSIYFNLNNGFTNLSGLYGPLHNVEAGTSATLTITGDGRTLGIFEVLASDPVRTFNVDVTGVTQLIIRYAGSGGWNGNNFAVANLALATSGNATTRFNQPLGVYNNRITLGEEVRAYRFVDADAITRSNPHVIMGAEYINGFRTSRRTGSAYFNIRGLYSTMTGVFGPLANVEAGTSATLTIFGDGRTLANFDMHASDPINSFTVDVTGVTQLRFVIVGSGGWNGNNFAIANVTLR